MSDEPTRDERAPAWSLDQTDVLAPTRVLAGKYRLGRLLGEGGMGAVYEAEHIELGSRVAVKLLSDHYATNPTAAKRVRREARAMAAIRHENIVAVTDTGTDNGTPYIVMELLEGESLSALLKRQGKLSPTLSAAVVLQVLDGVAAAHARGVVHRDLKPGNIFLTRLGEGDPRVKLLDFGVSKVASETEETTLTATGAAVGTPLYMSPEQLRGEPNIDGRSDLYSVGVLLYRMVTGRLPGAEIPPAERRAAILRGALPPPSKVASDIPRALEEVIVTAMAVEPEGRYPDAKRMREAIAEAAPDAATALSPTATKASTTAVKPQQPRRRPILAAIAALLCLGGAGFGVWWTYGRGGPASPAPSPEQGKAVEGAPAGAALDGPPLKLGMSTYTDREEQEKEYGPIARHLEERLGRRVELEIFPDIESLKASFLSGEVGVAALPPGAYVRLKGERPGIELLATTVTAGGSSFQVHIVTRAESDIERLEDLRGETFCFVPSADSGSLFPRDMLRRAGLDPEESVNVWLADDHVAALRHVANGRCSATAVYAGLYYNLDEPGLSQQAFHILESSESIPNDAYCALDDLDDDTVAAIREALLELEPGSETASRIFSGGQGLKGFGPATDEDYRRVRRALRREEESAAGSD